MSDIDMKEFPPSLLVDIFDATTPLDVDAIISCQSDKFVNEISDVYGRGNDGIGRFSEPGEPFSTICPNPTHSPIKPEGFECNMYESKAEAWNRFVAQFIIYSSHRKGPIYWRKEPELHEYEGKYSYSARLYIVPKTLREIEHDREDSR